MPRSKKTKTAKGATPETVLVLRTCDTDLRSYGGFQWPASGPVEAPNWSPRAECGNGLHGLLWGEGDGSLLDWSDTAKWLVCRVEASVVVEIQRKVKFPRCEVVHCGDQKSATEYLVANGGNGRAVVGGTATAGYGGTATAGDRGTATAGDRGTATAGYRGTATAGYGGTATAGYRGTATAGDGGTATAGYGGVIAILHWNGKRYKTRIATVKDEDGDGELNPGTAYRLNGAGEFVEVA